MSVMMDIEDMQKEIVNKLSNKTYIDPETLDERKLFDPRTGKWDEELTAELFPGVRELTTRGREVVAQVLDAIELDLLDRVDHSEVGDFRSSLGSMAASGV